MRFKKFLAENAGIIRLHSTIDKMSPQETEYHCYGLSADDDEMETKMYNDIGIPENHKIALKKAVDVLAQGDPSKDKKHLNQIYTWKMGGQFNAEDLGSEESHEHNANWDTVYGTLKAFSDPRNKDKIKDIPHPTQEGQVLNGRAIKNYPDWSDFRDKIHSELGLTNLSGGPIEHQKLLPIHSEDGLKVNRIYSKDAAIHLNKAIGAKWCTGWEGSDNRFTRYTAKGPLYHIHTPDDKHYLFHFENEEFTDKKNRRIDLPEFISQHPQLKNVPDFNSHYNPEIRSMFKPDTPAPAPSLIKRIFHKLRRQ